MVKVLTGDLFASEAQTLVNTVNCVGVMGKGVALEFKKRFPEMYEDYVKRCRARKVQLGRPYLYPHLMRPWVLNFPTKDHWRSVSRLEDIIQGLEYLESHYQEWGITSLAVPPLGCGQGGLEWRVVGPTLVRHLKRLAIPVELYAPYGTRVEELSSDFLDAPVVKAEAPPAELPMRIEPAWVALVAILDRIEREPYHRSVGRVMFQKIAYFATEAGVPTGLQYRRGSYGPFAPELKGIITRLANNSLIREDREDQRFTIRVGPTFSDARRVYGHALEQWRDMIERVTDLVLRMRARDAELAATVHLAAASLAARDREAPVETEVLDEVMAWKRRRKPALDREEVAAAIRHLGMLGWLHAAPSADLPLVDEHLVDDRALSSITAGGPTERPTAP